MIVDAIKLERINLQTCKFKIKYIKKNIKNIKNNKYIKK